jgi:predicted nucleic acid-binding protein
MKMIIDSNRIISALIKDGLTREIIISNKFQFYTLNYILDEIMKHKEYIIKKAKLNENQIDCLFNLIMENITIVSDKRIKIHINKAINIMKNIDIDDSPILACALAIENDGIWTEDKDFDKQNEIKIWKTNDLIYFL